MQAEEGGESEEGEGQGYQEGGGQAREEGGGGSWTRRHGCCGALPLRACPYRAVMVYAACTM